MKLEDIGFYTLTDERARNVSMTSDLQRCELLITSKCNFKCPYCRGTEESANITLKKAKSIVDKWAEGGLNNIRFSGGEPTVVPWLVDIIKHTKKKQSIKNIAISTNGSASKELYSRLIEEGCNDFSISLDACCAEVGDVMSGGKKGSWEKVVKNIKYISKKTYVTVGVVLTDETINTVGDIIEFASKDLCVSDIRIIPAAQFKKLFDSLNIKNRILEKHPILKYRHKNMISGRGVRGLSVTDNNKCPLILDDMSAKSNHHYPCIIKMREGCDPIGKISDSLWKIRQDRHDYFYNTNVFNDPICKNNCLDVCVDYNNKVLSYRNNR